jgi:large subunit ribosomal protein L29
MKVSELREKNIDDLRKLLLEQSTKQFKMRLEKGMGDAPKPSETKYLRREIARINTIINEKERQA